jgi:hypothetical protein
LPTAGIAKRLRYDERRQGREGDAARKDDPEAHGVGLSRTGNIRATM